LQGLRRVNSLRQNLLLREIKQHRRNMCQRDTTHLHICTKKRRFLTWSLSNFKTIRKKVSLCLWKRWVRSSSK